MMRFFFYENKTNGKEYTIRLIKHLIGPWLVTDPQDSDIVLMSMCDISEIGDIARARQMGRPILAGGMISEYPIVNELADYVWHGEIYAFRDALASGIGLMDMPSITTRARRRLVINEEIVWTDNPLIGVGRRARYFYVAKGCPVRCKYCYIGYARRYQVCPELRYRSAVRVAGKNLMPIAAYNPYGVPNDANIGETLLRNYAAGGKSINARMIRAGVEFVTPAYSESLAKGVNIDHVNEALARSRREQTKMILYFVAGIEDQDSLQDYFNRLAPDCAITPAVTVVFTYIDPQPFTPFHDYRLSDKITDIDTRAIYRVATGRNKRVKVLPLADPRKALYRTLMSRCESVDDYHWLRSTRGMAYQDIIEAVYKAKPQLMGNASLDQIMARRREAIPPPYWMM